MPIQPVVGPAGAGKSQLIASERRPGDVLIDYSVIWASITGAVRGEDGRYPVRENDDPSLPLVSAVYGFALSEAVRRGLDGYATTASRERVEGLERATGQRARVVDPGPGPILARLTETDDDGEFLNAQCVAASRRWWTNADSIVWHAAGVGSWKGPDGRNHRVRARPPRRRGRR